MHPATAEWLDLYAPDAERHRIEPTDRAGYWRLLAAVWRQGETFVVVEHDMEPRPDMLAEFDACPRPWCSAPYLGEPKPGRPRPLITHALGCTRFRGEFMQRDPDFIQGFDGRQWDRLDSELATRLMHAPFWCFVHVHNPEIKHHHAYH